MKCLKTMTIGGFISNVSRGSPNLSKSLQIKQNSNLIFHPLLVVKLDILFVLPSGTVGLPNRGRVVRQVGVAIVAVVLRHLGQVKQKSSSTKLPTRLVFTLLNIHCKEVEGEIFLVLGYSALEPEQNELSN